jgi:hypothetical protein
MENKRTRNILTHRVTAGFFCLAGGILVLLTACQTRRNIPAETAAPAWQVRTESYRIPRFVDAFRINPAVDTPTETMAEKFTHFSKEAERITGEPFPIFLCTQVATLSIEGWTRPQILPLGGPRSLQKVGIYDALQLFTELLGMRIDVTEQGPLISLDPLGFPGGNELKERLRLPPLQSRETNDIFGLPIQ